MNAPLATHRLDDGVEIELWRVAAADGPAMTLLDADERLRAARFRQPADRDRFVTGRLALRRALARRHGIPPADIAIAIEPGGRPFCTLAECFSLSHSGDLVLLALAGRPGLAVGVDVEQIERGVAVASLAAQVCGPEDMAWLTVDTPQADQRFIELWTCKEAALKCRGVGLSVDPRAARYDPASARVIFAPDTGLAPVRVIPLEVPPGYRAALARDIA